MEKQLRTTVSIDREIYRKYANYCKNKGFKIARQIELMIINEMGDYYVPE